MKKYEHTTPEGKLYRPTPPEPMIIAEGTTPKCGIWTLYKSGLLTIEGRGVLDDSSWEDYVGGIKLVHISEGITDIGRGVFYNHTKLMHVHLPDSLTGIGESAFEKCSSLFLIVVPSRVRYIGYRAFQNCARLASITLPQSVTFIGGSAFSGCSSLTGIDIPSSVTEIGKYVFDGCTNLNKVTMPAIFNRWIVENEVIAGNVVPTFFKRYYGIPWALVTFK